MGILRPGILLSVFSSALHAQDADIQTYKALKDFERSHKAEKIDGKPTTEFDGVEVFYIEAKYLGDHLPLKAETKEFLKSFAFTRGNSPAVLSFINAYTEEIRVNSGKSIATFLMQNDLMEFFLKEVEAGKSAKFKIRYLGHKDTTRKYAVIEFQALEPIKAPPQKTELDEAHVRLALVLPKEWQIVDKKANSTVRVLQMAVPTKEKNAKAPFDRSLIYAQFKRTGPEINAKAIFESTEKSVKDKHCLTEQIEIAHRSKNVPAKKVPEIFGFLYACQTPGISGFQAFVNADNETVAQFSLERPKFPITGDERDEYISWLHNHLLSCLSVDKDCVDATDPMAKAAGKDPTILLNPTFADTALDEKSAN